MLKCNYFEYDSACILQQPICWSDCPLTWVSPSFFYSSLSRDSLLHPFGKSSSYLLIGPFSFSFYLLSTLSYFISRISFLIFFFFSYFFFYSEYDQSSSIQVFFVLVRYRNFCLLSYFCSRMMPIRMIL